jgi:uncharacterized lipoprotein YddW (UPF0748 family)
MRLKYLFPLVFSTLLCAQTATEFRGVKLTNVDSDVLLSDDRIADAMDFLADIGINVVLTVVWNSNSYNGDYTLFPSAVMDSLFGFAIGPMFNNRDPLQRVIIEAHRNGIEVLPWFEMGFSSSWGSAYEAVPDHIIERYPHWALRDRDGKIAWKNGFFWLSAINPEVQDFIKALTLEVCRNYDLDGIEYSDRIPAMPTEGGYDSVTVAIYKAEHDGADPPSNYSDPDWMRWRADRLSDWFRSIRDAVKAHDPNLHVSSSPSVYPWSYQEYLQDSYTWMNTNICDDIIPQLYRYSFNDYLYTLETSLANFPNNRHTYIAGILMNVGSYVMSAEYLKQALQANRDRNVQGEVFFFYEGLRKNSNLLADTLKASFYAQPALLPHRNGQVWRPKALIVNEDDANAWVTGSWELLTSNTYGFQPNIYIKKDTTYAALDYYFDVPASGWYDILAYIVRSSYATKQAPYTVYSGRDSTTTYLDQTDYYRTGWQPVETAYLEKGYRKVLRLDNRKVTAGKWVLADAAMLMINRKLSPAVVFTATQPENADEPVPQTLHLAQNFPNPFNTATTFRFRLPASGQATLSVYNLQGREVLQQNFNELSAGEHTVQLNCDRLSSGVYFYRLETQQPQHNLLFPTRKMILLK